VAVAEFLKVISVVYLIIVWIAVALFFFVPVPGDAYAVAAKVLSIVGGISLSIPAAAMFAFAQVVEDVRAIRAHMTAQTDHLKAMRRYYELAER
jgi:hypothetical protein